MMMSNTDAPSHRTDLFNFRDSWTGIHMIIWGGRSSEGPYYGNPQPASQIRYDGAIYDLAEDSWTPMDTADDPRGRPYLHGVWTGNNLLVFAGDHEQGDEVGQVILAKTLPPIGHLYDPSGDLNGSQPSPPASWTQMETSGGPLQRKHGTAVWTGSEMIVWGEPVIIQTFIVMVLDIPHQLIPGLPFRLSVHRRPDASLPMSGLAVN